MSKLITKERLVSGGIGAAVLGVGYTLWQHFHRPHGYREIYAPREEGGNDRGEYGHKHRHHHKDRG